VTHRRKHRHHQFLTDEIGNVHLEKQITAVTTLMRATPTGNWKFFEMLFNQAFPPAQLDLFAGLDVEKLLDENNIRDEESCDSKKTQLLKKVALIEPVQPSQGRLQAG
jgi:hypothetical protein